MSIEEEAPGVYTAQLEPCTCQILPRVLVPDPGSFVWLVGYRPHSALRWVDLPLPLGLDQPAVPLRARLPVFDLQFSMAELLERLPQMHAWSGMVALQMSRPVPDTLALDRISGPGAYAILRQNGWLLTFYLPHDGETALLTSPDRPHLERVLRDPVVAAGNW